MSSINSNGPSSPSSNNEFSEFVSGSPEAIGMSNHQEEEQHPMSEILQLQQHPAASSSSSNNNSNAFTPIITTASRPPIHVRTTSSDNTNVPASAALSSSSSTSRPLDLPLHYVSQYSPSHASRQLRVTDALPTIVKSSRSTSPAHSKGVATAASSSIAASAAATPASNIGGISGGIDITRVPSPSLSQPNKSFLSAIFGGWAASASSAPPSHSAGVGSGNKPTSISLPTSPNEGIHASGNASTATPSLQYPHSASNARAAAASSAAGSTSAASTPSHGHRSSISLSASQPTGLNIMLHKPSLIGGVSHHNQHQVIQPLTPQQRQHLLSYSTRLKSSLSSHEHTIAKLQQQKKRYQYSRNEETLIWNRAGGISSLVSIASSLYHTHLLHVSGLLQMEFGFTTELAEHLNRVQLVLEEKLAIGVLLEEIEQAQNQQIEKEEQALTILSKQQQQHHGHQQHNSSQSNSHQLILDKKRRELRELYDARERRRKMSGEKASGSMMSGHHDGATTAGGVTSSSLLGTLDAIHPSLTLPPLSSSPPRTSTTISSSSSSPLYLSDRFLTTREIESIFCPLENAMLNEQISSLSETAAKLELTYLQMQSKVLMRSEVKSGVSSSATSTSSKATRTFRYYTFLVTHGIESDSRDIPLLSENMFFLRMEKEQVEKQKAFNEFVMREGGGSGAAAGSSSAASSSSIAQLSEEGKQIQKWLDSMFAQHAETIVGGTPLTLNHHHHQHHNTNLKSPNNPKPTPLNPQSILTFIQTLSADILKRYECLTLIQQDRDKERMKKEESMKYLTEKESEESGAMMKASAAAAAAATTADQLDDTAICSSPLDDEQPYFTLTDALQLYLHRLLFPQLSLLVSSLRTEQESDLDAWFSKKLSWIRRLTREQMGLNKYFLPPGTDMQGGYEGDIGTAASGAAGSSSSGTKKTQQHLNVFGHDDLLHAHHDHSPASSSSSFTSTSSPSSTSSLTSDLHLNYPPYESAMSLLHCVNTAVDSQSPLDVLYLFIRTIREITRLANGYLEMHRVKEREEVERAAGLNPGDPLPHPTPASKESLHADAIFPLVVYVLVHAGLRCPHFVFGTLTRFVPSDLRTFGMTGYSLATFESAVAFVNDMCRQDVQGNNESKNTTMIMSPRKRTMEREQQQHSMNASSSPRSIKSPQQTKLAPSPRR